MIRKAISRKKFSFFGVSVKGIFKEIKMISTKKANKSNDIPTKILKQNADIFGDYTYSIFEKCIETSTFSDILKHVNIRHFFQKGIQTRITISQ